MRDVVDLAGAVAAERLRNARQFARFRTLGTAAMLALNLSLEARNPAFIGVDDWALAAYAAMAAVVFVCSRSSDVVARWSARAIPWVDLPLVYLLLESAISEVRSAGYADDASSTATQAALFYLVFVIAASLSLGEGYTWLTAAVAIALQSALMLGQGRDWSFVAIVALATVLGTQLSLYGRRRNLALVRAAAEEQARRERLGRYFSPQVAAAVLGREDQFGRGEVCDVTVLFADLRGFTQLAEGLDGRETVALLNAFHERMVAPIFARGGTLDKYVGDGLMAYFGAPVPRADHAELAVRCALDMHAALASMNRDRIAAGVEPLRLGIGIHSGSVVLGDIGAASRREFTAIGDTVNVAARIEELTKTHAAAILLSDATRSRLPAGLDCTPLPPVVLRGRAAPLQLYRLDPTGDSESASRESR